MQLVRKHYERYKVISEILDRNPEIVNAVHKDLCAGEKKLKRNIEGVTSETVLRMIVVQRVEGLSFRETVIRIADSQMLCVFCRVYDDEPVDFTTYNKLANMIRPETWERINAILVRYGRDKKGIQGEKLRIDTTLVETDIHYPTDSSLLFDGVRKLSSLIGHVRDLAPALVGKQRAGVNRARKLAHALAYELRGKKEHQARTRKRYRALIALAERTIGWAVEVREKVEAYCGKTKGLVCKELEWRAEDLRTYVERTQRCVQQARRRVLEGTPVPNKEKIFSIFEAHTELIKRGKAGKEVEFGHMVEIRQVAAGLITGYQTHAQRPAAEADLVVPAVRAHKAVFGQAPKVCATDKGFYSEKAVEDAREMGVKLVAIPQKGHRDAARTREEHSFLFKLAQRFRAGIEAAVSYLKRVFGLDRCLQEGFLRFESWVGTGVFDHNLVLLSSA
jgi:IS5 family transposase